MERFTTLQALFADPARWAHRGGIVPSLSTRNSAIAFENTDACCLILGLGLVYPERSAREAAALRLRKVIAAERGTPLDDTFFVHVNDDPTTTHADIVRWVTKAGV